MLTPLPHHEIPETVAITATAIVRRNLFGAPMQTYAYTSVTTDGELDVDTLARVLKMRGVIDVNAEPIALAHVEDWRYLVVDRASGRPLAELEVHAGAGA